MGPKPKSTWRPHDTHGTLSAAKEKALPETAFAFPTQRLGPLTGEAYVRQTIERFPEFEGVTDEDRELAFENIRKAARRYRVPMTETDWRQLGTRAQQPYFTRPES